MTRLLVSVRSAEEAASALAGGADLIDVKEPRAGSLGAALPEVWQAVASAIATARPLSAALGELQTFQPGSSTVLQGYRYAKLGLAGCAQHPEWPNHWQAALATLPQWINPVAVVYADVESAQAPLPEEILRTGAVLGCRTLLVDTFDKQQGSVFDCLGAERLTSLFAEARQHEMQLVLAGSLQLSSLSQALELSPDYVAIRGAVCRPTRAGTLQQDLVRDWASRLALTTPPARAVGEMSEVG